MLYPHHRVPGVEAAFSSSPFPLQTPASLTDSRSSSGPALWGRVPPLWKDGAQLWSGGAGLSPCGPLGDLLIALVSLLEAVAGLSGSGLGEDG